MQRGLQRYYCGACKKLFRNKRRQRNTAVKDLWRAYVFGKHTMREMSCDKRTIRKLFATYQPPAKRHQPRRVHLVVDATYFGERTVDTAWCVAVARDPRGRDDLVWQFAKTETTSLYSELRTKLETYGYTIVSVTADGFSGIRSAFNGIPYQMCQVHMERLVTVGTTRRPRTEAAGVLRALVRTLHTTTSAVFNERLDAYIVKYQTFLNEKTTSPETGEEFWTHKELRTAVIRLLRHRAFLFTFEQNNRIPKTTNSIEGHFSHLNEIVAIHRGLSRSQKQKVITTILLASTTAPTKAKLKHVL